MQRPGVGRSRARTSGRTPALDYNNRFLAADAACDLRELSWVSERLEIKQDYIGAFVRLPIAKQIVSGDICLVAD